MVGMKSDQVIQAITERWRANDQSYAHGDITTLLAEVEQLRAAVSDLVGAGEDMHSMLVCLLGAAHPQVERHYQKFEAVLTRLGDEPTQRQVATDGGK